MIFMSSFVKAFIYCMVYGILYAFLEIAYQLKKYTEGYRSFSAKL